MTNSWFSEIPKVQPKNKENKKIIYAPLLCLRNSGAFIIDKHKNKCYNA